MAPECIIMNPLSEISSSWPTLTFAASATPPPQGRTPRSPYPTSATVIGTFRALHRSCSCLTKPSMLTMATTRKPSSSLSASKTSHHAQPGSLTPTSRAAR